MELNKIYKEDCLEGMKRIPNASIDCIICDLPYGVLNKKNDFSKWDVPLSMSDLWFQYERIIKDRGAIILFGQGIFSAELMFSNRKLWRYNLIWDKVRKTGFLNSKRAPLRQHEDILVFYKKSPVYNPQMVKCPLHKRNHSKGNMQKPALNSCYGEFVQTPTIISDEKFPTSIISISKEHKKDNFFHPTQKPVALIEYLIRTYTDEGNIVLDNCIGSGTTAVACLNTNRRFIGFEKVDKYYNIACKRISDIITSSN